MMNHTIRARLSSSSSRAVCRALTRQPRPLARTRTRLAHTHAATPRPANDVPLMKPVFAGVTLAVAGGVAYALSRSSGRIGSRFEAREKTLDRTKWLHEGVQLDSQVLNTHSNARQA